jgi:putative ABC transport system permease protein
MLAVSTGLILAMLVARTSIEAKINEVKAATATEITINPAGVSGGLGGGDALTSDQLKQIESTAHIKSTTATLMDQLGESDTNLTPSLELGNLGKRQFRFETKGQSGGAVAMPDGGETTPFKPRTSITGTTIPGNKTLASGTTIDGKSSNNEAIVGKSLAEKNNLTVGSTFTAYGTTMTVKGIYSTGNTFEDSGIIVPLATLQTLTNQPGAISHLTAIVDSSDNVATTVSALKSSLGDKVDITSQQEQAETSLAPLQGISNLALTGVIGASLAGAAIVLLSMTIIVRERRREIGVLKAIGGTNIKIVGQFVTEALTLTIIGGVIGLGLGIAVSGPVTQSLVANSEQSGPKVGEGGPRRIEKADFSAVVSNLGESTKSVTTSLPPQVFASSIGLILLIAIIGSSVPALAIARVRPAEVLRSE